MNVPTSSALRAPMSCVTRRMRSPCSGATCMRATGPKAAVSSMSACAIGSCRGAWSSTYLWSAGRTPSTGRPLVSSNGLHTQNSLPSGSSIWIHSVSSSARRPSGTRVAPNPSRRCASASMSGAVTSMCMRFLADFGSSTRCSNSRGRRPSRSRSTAYCAAEPACSYPSAAVQNRVITSRSAQSKTSSMSMGPSLHRPSRSRSGRDLRSSEGASRPPRLPDRPRPRQPRRVRGRRLGSRDHRRGRHPRPRRLC